MAILPASAACCTAINCMQHAKRSAKVVVQFSHALPSTASRFLRPGPRCSCARALSGIRCVSSASILFWYALWEARDDRAPGPAETRNSAAFGDHFTLRCSAAKTRHPPAAQVWGFKLPSHSSTNYPKYRLTTCGSLPSALSQYVVRAALGLAGYTGPIRNGDMACSYATFLAVAIQAFKELQTPLN
jgi:hypothetical protein